MAQTQKYKVRLRTDDESREKINHYAYIHGLNHGDALKEMVAKAFADNLSTRQKELISEVS